MLPYEKVRLTKQRFVLASTLKYYTTQISNNRIV